MNNIQEMNIENDDDKLKNVLLSTHVNRDSLSRNIPQDLMLTIDFLVNHLTGSLYGSLERAIAKDEKTMDMMHHKINSILDDLKRLQKQFFNLPLKH